MKQCVEANRGVPFKGVLHIGAHHGEEAEAYQQCGVRNVLWVEANRDYMKTLYEHCRNVPIKNKYFNVVLSDVDNENLLLNVANNGQSTSILEFGTHATMYPHITFTKRVPVKARRFDAFYRENIFDIDLDEYDFINLDVQGAELKVLKGFGDLFERFPFKAVYSEVNLEEVYKGCCLIDELDEHLAQYGFTRLLTATPEGTWGDALWLRP